MKKRIIFKTVLITALFAVVSLVTVKAQISFHNGRHLFVGQKPNGWQDVGSGTNVIVGQQWGIEFFENGLNMWRLWPNSNFGNYKIFIDQDGKVGIGGSKIMTIHKLNVNGSHILVQNVLLSSDRALKRNINKIREKIL